MILVNKAMVLRTPGDPVPDRKVIFYAENYFRLECYLDSPWFRQSIQDYENELENTNTQIKQLIKDAKNMINASKTQGKMMNLFNERLQNFKFNCIGENLTDDEKRIAGSLKEFGLMLEEVTREWGNTVERAEKQLIKPMEDFRKVHIHKFRESKKLFDKASERYYKYLEHTLGLSHKKKDTQLQESDKELLNLKKYFHQEALNYVHKLQEVQERKKFEFVEYLLMFMQAYFNFFRQSHETALDCKDYMTDLQGTLVLTREQYIGTLEKTQSLMRKMEDKSDLNDDVLEYGGKRWSRAGYLFLMEKNTLSARLTSKWTKYFCIYTKENKLFQMMSSHPSNSSSGSNAGAGGGSSGVLNPVIVATCTRRMTDTIDKRFCFDLEVEDTSGKEQLLTVQAISDFDRRKWMEVMGGKEPQYTQCGDFKKKDSSQFKLDEMGFKFVEDIIAEIEHRGVSHEGIYRLVGVLSKVDVLIAKAVDPKDSVDYANDEEWEINTLTSALKSSFRNLPDPLMTFDLHHDFINAAKLENHEDRVTRVAELVNTLPEANKKVLGILTKHLRNVAECHVQNKMTVQNLGVCFGPTLMRDRQETVQSIMEIKFSNIIVEILIEARDMIFGGVGKEDKQKKTGYEETPVSPRLFVQRLPSQRLRNRPKAVYEIQSLENVLEGEQSRGKFSRGKAIRSNRNTPSPHRDSYEKEAAHNSSSPSHDDSMTSSDDDELKFSPIDLNLNFEEVTPKVSPVYENTKSSNVASSTERKTKEHWAPAKLKPVAPPRISSFNDKPALSRSKPPVNKNTAEVTASTSKSKRRVTSITRRKPLNALSEENNLYTEVNKNKNANNNNNSKPPTKPKSLAVASLMQKKKKFKASMKGVLTSPTAPVKYTRKKFMQSNGGHSNNRSNDNPGKIYRKSPNPNRRPVSAIIPAVFLAEELKVRGISEDEEQPGPRPRASALVTSRDTAMTPSRSTPKASIDTDTSSSSSCVSLLTGDGVIKSIDDVIVSSEAKTLYLCEAEQPGELSFEPGKLLKNVTTTDEPGWIRAQLDGKEGLVPMNYVKFI